MAAGTQGGGRWDGPALSESVYSRGVGIHVQGDHERPAHEAGAAQVYRRRPQAALQVRRGRQENDRNSVIPSPSHWNGGLIPIQPSFKLAGNVAA